MRKNAKIRLGGPKFTEKVKSKSREHYKDSLVAYGENPWDERLFKAIRQEDASLIKLALDSGGRLAVRNEHERSPLFEAAYFGSSHAIRLLLDYGVSLDERDAFLRTALHLASSNGQAAAVRTLILLGARLDLRDENGETALYGASLANELAIVRALMKAGASIEVANYEGSCPLFVAEKYAKIEVLALMVYYSDDRQRVMRMLKPKLREEVTAAMAEILT